MQRKGDRSVTIGLVLIAVLWGGAGRAAATPPELGPTAQFGLPQRFWDTLRVEAERVGREMTGDEGARRFAKLEPGEQLHQVEWQCVVWTLVVGLLDEAMDLRPGTRPVLTPIWQQASSAMSAWCDQRPPGSTGNRGLGILIYAAGGHVSNRALFNPNRPAQTADLRAEAEVLEEKIVAARPLGPGDYARIAFLAMWLLGDALSELAPALL